MMRSLFSGVSGLRNHQTRMDVIGNNIANVNTVGFKGSRVNFQDVLSQTLQGASSSAATRGGTNPIQVGLGMGLASIDTLFTDGSFQPTGKMTDLSIAGQGFFILTDNDGTNKYYTRAGNFDLDDVGNFCVPGTGNRVMGWMADASGNLNTSTSRTPIKINLGQTMPARASTRIDYSNNLSGSNGTGASMFTSIKTYDSLGNPHDVNQTFVKVGTNRWLAKVDVPDISGATGVLREITFKADGTINTIQNATAAASPTTALTLNGMQLNNTLNSQGTGYFTVFDPTGAPRVFKINFTNTAANTWSYTINDASDPKAPSVGGGVVNYAGGYNFSVPSFTYGSPGTTVNFTSPFAGTAPADGASTLLTHAATYTTGAQTDLVMTPTGANVMTIKLNYNDITQFGAAQSDLQAFNQDGYAAGNLSNVTFDPSGVMVGVFSNGETKKLAQVALATFSNPAGLNKAGNNLYTVSNNSGEPNEGPPGTGNRAKVSPGTLEMSNVDLAQEFSNMIITQRGFQANSKIISVTDEMLQELANLKR